MITVVHFTNSVQVTGKRSKNTRFAEHRFADAILINISPASAIEFMSDLLNSRHLTKIDKLKVSWMTV